MNSTKSSASIASFNPGGIFIIVLSFILHRVTAVIKVNFCGIRAEEPFGTYANRFSQMQRYKKILMFGERFSRINASLIEESEFERL